ncbi:MAG TPA: LuxR C-terminal-related transcriptional regulator [Kiloniellales bacterium]|nr:LuxR C-terminal-related transcriptional regulator [Kiloniellales bacterium]
MARRSPSTAASPPPTSSRTSDALAGFDHARFAEALGRLVEAEGAARIEPLVAALRVGAAFHHWLAAVFRAEQPPLLLGDSMQEPEPSYDAGPYLLDPFYHRYLAGAFGWSTLSEIAPADFGRSDYVATYYNKLGIAHEIGFIAALGDSRAFHLSLTRGRGEPPFARRERDWLESMSPLLRSVGRGLAPQAGADPAARSLHASLSGAFARFGTSVLTEREVEVVRLLLQGHLAKSIARELGISPGTARNHLKRIYPKLGVASHAELYALFLKALRVTEGEGDPLERMR